VSERTTKLTTAYGVEMGLCRRYRTTTGRPPDEINSTSSNELIRPSAGPSLVGIDFWDEGKRDDSRNAPRMDLLQVLNEWRNAIAHQSFSGSSTLQLVQARQWRRACGRLAASFDSVMNRQLRNLTGAPPW
jgi:hypothetical protein